VSTFPYDYVLGIFGPRWSSGSGPSRSTRAHTYPNGAVFHLYAQKPVVLFLPASKITLLTDLRPLRVCVTCSSCFCACPVPSVTAILPFSPTVVAVPVPTGFDVFGPVVALILPPLAGSIACSLPCPVTVPLSVLLPVPLPVSLATVLMTLGF